jgi:hypothetical protein
MNNVGRTTSVNSKTTTIETLKIKVESTIRTTRIITTGMTTKIAPGGSILRKTTRVLTNSRRRTRKSSRNTGSGAMLIQIRTSKLPTSDEETWPAKIRPVRDVTGGTVGLVPLRVVHGKPQTKGGSPNFEICSFSRRSRYAGRGQSRYTGRTTLI